VSDVARRRVNWLNVLAVALVVVGIVAATIIVTVGQREEPSPVPPPAIDYDAVRIVGTTVGGLVRIPQVPGYEQPSVLVGDDVPLEFSRCADFGEAETIDAIAETWWVTEDGDRIPHAPPVEVEIAAGCTTLRVALAMPNAVAVANVDAFADLDDLPDARLWTLEGLISPVDADYDPSLWVSEPFLIVNTDPLRFPSGLVTFDSGDNS
jgi:hypothetical protein